MARSRAGTMRFSTAARSRSSLRSVEGEAGSLRSTAARATPVDATILAMTRFSISDTPIDTGTLRAQLLDDRVGGYASFEGRVRNHNDGRNVLGLRYEAYT